MSSKIIIDSVEGRCKIRNGKKIPLCDFNGTCTNLAYKEVYPSLISKKKGWSYLCRKHFKQEQRRLKNKLPYSDILKDIAPIKNYKNKLN
jgi:hypothetical protein